MRRPSSSTQRWPLVHALSEGDPASRRRARAVALILGLTLLIAAPVVPQLPFALRVGCGALALLAFAYAARLRLSETQDGIGAPAIIADARGLKRMSVDGEKPIVTWESPFGVTLLASYGRPYALLAFTTPKQTRYIPVRIDHRGESDDELFARIAVLADLDLVDGVTHDAALRPSDAADVVRHAMTHGGGDVLGRVFLSDGRGSPISLDRATLSVGGRTFDLTSHLEWRALMFHESTGQAAALYQATWMKQNGAELVLVAPMPASIVPREPNAHKEASGKLGRALTRDLRLLQSPAEPPPPRDVRIAIDRPFMMAVRRLLDEAPLATRIATPSTKTRAEERDSIV